MLHVHVHVCKCMLICMCMELELRLTPLTVPVHQGMRASDALIRALPGGMRAVCVWARDKITTTVPAVLPLKKDVPNRII